MLYNTKKARISSQNHRGEKEWESTEGLSPFSLSSPPLFALSLSLKWVFLCLTRKNMGIQKVFMDATEREKKTSMDMNMEKKKVEANICTTNKPEPWAHTIKS